MAGEYVRARLRKKDQDLRDDLDYYLGEGMEEGDLVRAALRFYFAHIESQGKPEAFPAAVRPARQPRPRKQPQRSGPPEIARPPVLKKTQDLQPGTSGSAIDDLLGGF
jgi:hypothetical protein